MLDENAVAVKADFTDLEAMRKEAEAKREAERAAEEEAARLAEEARLAAMREVEVRYRRSFLSRYIQSEDYIKEYYTEIKNALLSYKGVKARVAWGKESFKCGRVHIAKLDVKGKALYLYLALDPRELDAKYFVTEAKGECPALIKIKSARKLKQSLELVEMLMARLGLKKTERTAEDYRMPYEETEALIERGLIKVILPKGEVLDENAVAVKADFTDLEAMRKEAEAKREAERAAEEALAAMAEPVSEESEEAVEAEPAEEAVEAEPVEETVEAELAEETVEAELAEETVEAEPAEEAVEAVEEAPEEAIEEPVEEISVEQEVATLPEEEVMAVTEEAAIEKKIDDIVDRYIKGGPIYISLHSTPAVYRGNRGASELPFAFKGGNEGQARFVVPYTREEYLALPRKKKKSVLMNVKALLRYSATERLIAALVARGSDNERINERIAALRARLATQKRALPTASLWLDAVKRVVK